MVSISRVSRDGRSAILKSSTGYDVFSLDSSETISGEFQALVAAGSWRRPTKGDAEAFADLLTLADGSIVASVEAVEPQRPRTFKAPKNVRNEINAALMEFSALLSDSDRDTARRIVSGPVTQEDIQWMHTFFSQVEKAQKLRGGQYGQRWAAKICAIQDPLTASVAPFADDLYYYGLADTEGSHEIQSLIAIDPNTNSLYEWENGIFTLKDEEDLSDIDEPFILPLDGETAAAVATWINQQPEDNPFGYDVYNGNPEERNLYEMAAPSLDFEQLGRVASVVAAAYGRQRFAKAPVSRSGYTSAERAANVARQPRQPGGKFGSGKNVPGATAKPGTKLSTTAFAKASLATVPGLGALMKGIKSLVTAWLLGSGKFKAAPRKARAPRTKAQLAHTKQVRARNKAIRAAKAAAAARAAHHASTDTTYISAISASASSASAVTQDVDPDSLTSLPAEPLYIAIVDDVDNDSVLDVVAIRTNETTAEPEAWVRTDGNWVENPDMLAKLEGSAPPSCREIEDPNAVKEILRQVDDHDGKKAAPQADSTSSSDQIKNLSTGFALPDGSFEIRDVAQLSAAVDTLLALDEDVQFTQLSHVRTRAKALNRLDLVPEFWRTASFLEKGVVAAASSLLYGEYGEIVAGGSLKGHADGAARLQAYWTTGKGALKIRWGTPGDLTRAHRHLAKYVGEGEAWGLAQNYHESLFGVSNIVHDRATGQYVSHGRK